MFIGNKCPVGSVDWLYCNLNEALNILSDRNTIWLIVPEFAYGCFLCCFVLPLDTWDFPVGELDVAVLKALL